MSSLVLESAWEAVERGATLGEACETAGAAGSERGSLLADLRTLLAGELRLARLAPRLKAPHLRLLALRALDGDEAAARKLGRVEVDVEELRADEARLFERADPTLTVAQRGSVSRTVARGLIESLGEGAEAFLRASWSASSPCLRANVARIPRDELRARLAEEGLATEPTRLCPHGLTVQLAGPLAPTRAFEEGLFEVQDEASQLVAHFVDPLRSAPTVDACAGAGGKTLALCAGLGKRGRVVALDRNERRLTELRRRAARAQAFNLLVHATPAEGARLSAPLADLQGRAARVLVDAPCSGLGAMRRKPDVARRIDEAMLARLPEQQFEIARAALRWLRPDGRLIYATCTPLWAENEAVVARLVASEGLEALPLHAWLPPEFVTLAPDPSATVLRLLPHVHGTDAFTVHVLTRKALDATAG